MSLSLTKLHIGNRVHLTDLEDSVPCLYNRSCLLHVICLICHHNAIGTSLEIILDISAIVAVLVNLVSQLM